MIIPDWKIRELDLFDPFLENKQQSKNKLGTGLSSYGYDLSLSDKEFLYFRNSQRGSNHVIDPKEFYSDKTLQVAQMLLDSNSKDKYFILPAFSTGLGVAKEFISLPNNIVGQVVGKSTYARCGIICPITPIESGWNGYLTIELFNSTNYPCRIYVNEGVCQVILYESEECEVDYSQREGKYQNQLEEVTLAKINK